MESGQDVSNSRYSVHAHVGYKNGLGVQPETIKALVPDVTVLVNVTVAVNLDVKRRVTLRALARPEINPNRRPERQSLCRPITSTSTGTSLELCSSSPPRLKESSEANGVGSTLIYIDRVDLIAKY